MAKCSFCGVNIEKGTGVALFMNDGKVFNFCSRKCEKNLRKLGRNPRDFKWTKDYQKG